MGEINANDYDKLEFYNIKQFLLTNCHMKNLERVYGNTDCDDIDVWESLHPECQGRQLFRVGSSDPHFVLTGTTYSTTSMPDARQSHEVLLLLLLFSQCCCRASRTGLENQCFLDITKNVSACMCVF
ncbi:hypothetical protein Hanom_Chr16g01443771 [Helianthus anomalus]